MAKLSPPPRKDDPRFDDWLREMYTRLVALEGGPSSDSTLTPAQAADLTDGGESSAHYHAADRSRANHTGTQPSSTISDFNGAVLSLISTGGGHPALSDLLWTSSGHIGTASRLAGFNSSGDAAEYAIPLTVANGGTGRATSTTAYGLLAAGTTATGAHQTLAAGATTEILVGGGAAALPVWTTATGSGAPVRATSPTLVTPNIGAATGTSLAISGELRTGGIADQGAYALQVGGDALIGTGTSKIYFATSPYGVGIMNVANLGDATVTVFANSAYGGRGIALGFWDGVSTLETPLVVDASGFVGLGTNNTEAPAKKLHVFTDSSNGALVEQALIDGGTQSTTTSGSGQVIGFRAASDAYYGLVGGYGDGSSAGIGLWGGTSSGTPSVFLTSSALTITPATMTWSGNPTHSGTHTFSSSVTAASFAASSSSGISFPSNNSIQQNSTNLWLVQTGGTSALYLADSVDNDRAIKIQYAPGTTGAGAGALIVGQTAKNHANFTHGSTAFYTNGIERLTINSSGTLGRSVDNSTLTIQGGSTTGDGGRLVLEGPSGAGTFVLHTRTGGTAYSLSGAPSGTLEWTGTTATLANAVIRGADGSAAAPTYSFASSGHNDNGMYLDGGADALGFACAGSRVISLSTSQAVFANEIIGQSSIKSEHATAGIGYRTGAGGTVTQGSGSGKATTVTLNKACGEITMDSATLNANTTVSFTFTNSALAAADLIHCVHASGGTVGSYLIHGRGTGSGSGTITVRNITAGNLGEAIVIRFAVIKGVTS